MNDNPAFEILLRSRNMSVSDLARETGISEPQVRAIIAGKHLPRVDKALRIADALNVRVSDLWKPEAA